MCESSTRMSSLRLATSPPTRRRSIAWRAFPRSFAAYMQREGVELLYSFDDEFDDEFDAIRGITRLESPDDPFE